MSWELVQAGNRDAFEAFISSKVNLAFAGARSYGISGAAGVMSDHDDAVQMALIYAFECFEAGSFADMTEADFDKWLWRSARGRASRIVRHSRAQVRDARRTQAIGQDDYAGSVGGSTVDVSELVDQACDGSMSMLQEVASGLLSGNSASEIATATGLSIEQVWRRIKRVRDNLQKVLA